MTDAERRVADLVRSAFQGIVLGDGIGLHQGRGLDGCADAETLAKYRLEDEKDDWSRIPLSELNQYGDSLCFMDAEGMRFHLPAYLLADLEGAMAGDVIFHCAHSYPGAMSRFDRLDERQRNAVREFLLLRVADPDREFERPMIEKALAEYWTVPKESADE
jgi:hypothetical protein